jgi:hypothetical protein
MRAYAGLLLKPVLLLTIILTFIGFAVIPSRKILSSDSLNNKKPNQQQAINSLKVNNKAGRLEVVSVERKGQSIRLQFKNNYSKTINAYVLSPGGYQVIYELEDKDFIPPGGTHERSINVQRGQIEDRINIMAVVFDDKTGDGDSAAIKEIKDLRLGRKIQLNRIIPYLDSILKSTDATLSQSLQNVRIKINNLPIGSEQEFPHHVLVGLRDIRETALKSLEELDQVRRDSGNDIFMQQLAKLRALFLKEIEKY